MLGEDGNRTCDLPLRVELGDYCLPVDYFCFVEIFVPLSSLIRSSLDERSVETREKISSFFFFQRNIRVSFAEYGSGR
jgi:hypothetical protein